MLKRQVAGWIAAALVPGVAVAAIEDGIGQIVSSSAAAVNGAPVPGQGTIMPGNLLTTGLDGRAVVEFSGGSQVNVFENTTTAFKSEAGGIQAQLSSGTIAARSLGRETITVETRAYRVAPIGQAKTVYVVAILSDKTTVVSGRIGKVLITQLASGKRYVLDEGHYVELAVAPSDAPASPGSQSDAPGHGSRTPPGISAAPTGLFILAIGAGAGIGAGVLIDRAVSGPGPASPSRP